MTDPFDDLERQLRAKVRERAQTGTPPVKRRWRIGRGPLIVIAALGLTASGAAVAATGLHFSKSDRQQGDGIANQAINESYRRGACKPPLHDDPTTLHYVDATASTAITDALPWLTTPVSHAQEAHALHLLAVHQAFAGSVLRGTVRVITARPGQHVLIYVQTQGFWTATDPVHCAQIRRARAVQLAAGKSSAVRDWALAVIDSDPAVNGDAQSLEIITDMPCPRANVPASGSGSCGWGGGGTGLIADSASPRARLRLGVEGFSESNGVPFSRYYGIAAPAARRILVHATHRSKLGRVPRYAVVHHGIWVLDLPMNTGPVKLTEVDKTGRVLRRMTVRDVLASQRAAQHRAAKSKAAADPAPVTAVHLH